MGCGCRRFSRVFEKSSELKEWVVEEGSVLALVMDLLGGLSRARGDLVGPLHGDNSALDVEVCRQIWRFTANKLRDLVGRMLEPQIDGDNYGMEWEEELALIACVGGKIMARGFCSVIVMLDLLALGRPIDPTLLAALDIALARLGHNLDNYAPLHV